MTEKKPPTDWEQAERLYRAGALSLAEIAARVGVSKVAVKKHMDKAGIHRDLTAAVRQETKRKLAEQAVNDSVNGFHGKRAKALTEREIIEANATVGQQVVECHRTDIKAGREIVALLIGQLYQTTTNVDEISEAIKDETAKDPFPNRRRMMLNAVSLPSRAGVIKDLANAMKSLQSMERVAFGLKDDDGEADLPDYEKRLEALANGAGGEQQQ